MNNSLQELQQTLANLQKQYVMPSLATPQTNVIDKELIRKLVKEVLEEINPKQTIVSSKLTIQDAICAALTQEEQNWLCEEQKILNIPNFLVTSEGKEVTKLFLTSYRDYFDANTP